MLERDRAANESLYRARPSTAPARRVLVRRPAELQRRAAAAAVILLVLFVAVDLLGANVRVTLTREAPTTDAFGSPLPNTDPIRCRIETVRVLFPRIRTCDSDRPRRFSYRHLQGTLDEYAIELPASAEDRHDAIRESVPVAPSHEIGSLNGFVSDHREQHLSVTIGSPWRRVPVFIVTATFGLIAAVWWLRRTRIVVDAHGVVHITTSRGLSGRESLAFSQTDIRWVTIEGTDDKHVHLTIDLLDGRRIALPSLAFTPRRALDERRALESFLRPTNA
ncbi:Hypothetical protein A7982_00154 [Minicystis rosea]|nr:Hypothetical protein A7982_00154 [Minicystis rosea]